MGYTFIAVDDEKHALFMLENSIKTAVPDCQLHQFRKPHEVIDFLTTEQIEPDVAFLDVAMPGMTGLELAKQVKELSPRTQIIFVTGYSEYAVEAYRMHAKGYLLKPVLPDAILEEVELLGQPIKDEETSAVRIQCFGNFEIYYHGEPVHFKYSKTREMLAYLVDRRGAFCSNGEIISILWEDENDILKRKSHFRNLRADLIGTFREMGLESAICKQRGMTAISLEKISCDYYDWLKGDVQAVNRYNGEYMSQYSWGEMTIGAIENI